LVESIKNYTLISMKENVPLLEYSAHHISLVFSLYIFISAYISHIAEKMSGQLEVLLSIHVYLGLLILCMDRLSFICLATKR
jgi:hypothetical protein